MSSNPNAVVLILGGRTGLLGQALTRVVRDHGWKPVTLGREDGDILDPAWLDTQLAAIDPGAVFNTVAWTQVDLAEKQLDAAMRINRGLPVLLGRLLKGSRVPLMHYSTDFVFSGRKDAPYTPADTPDPTTVYGSTKLAGERALQDAGLDVCCIMRTAWLFGPGRKNFVRTILEQAATKTSLSVVHDQVGSPTYTMDLARASLELLNHRADGLFHLANSGEASWCELAAEAVTLASLPCSIQAIDSSAWPQLAQRPAYSALDASLYTSVTGKTMRPWPQALRDYVFQDFLSPSMLLPW